MWVQVRYHIRERVLRCERDGFLNLKCSLMQNYYSQELLNYEQFVERFKTFKATNQLYERIIGPPIKNGNRQNPTPSRSIITKSSLICLKQDPRAEGLVFEASRRRRL